MRAAEEHSQHKPNCRFAEILCTAELPLAKWDLVSCRPSVQGEKNWACLETNSNSAPRRRTSGAPAQGWRVTCETRTLNCVTGLPGFLQLSVWLPWASVFHLRQETLRTPAPKRHKGSSSRSRNFLIALPLLKMAAGCLRPGLLRLLSILRWRKEVCSRPLQRRWSLGRGVSPPRRAARGCVWGV